MLKSNTKYRSLVPGCTCNVHVIKVFYTGATYIKAKCALVSKASGSLVEKIQTYKIPLTAIEDWEEL